MLLKLLHFQLNLNLYKKLFFFQISLSLTLSLFFCPQSFAEEVNRTLFDIFLGDSFQGYIFTTYTNEWFEIENPSDLIPQLKDLKKDAFDKVKDLVSDKIFGSKTIEGCGMVKVDSNTFRIILTLEENNFENIQKIDPKLLGNPVQNLSLREDFQITRVSSDESSGSYRSLTVGSYGRFWSRTDIIGIEVDNEQSYRLPEASLNSTFGYHRFSAGLLQTQGDRLAPSLNIIGLGFTTINDIISNDRELRSSLFQIYVPATSRVDFYRAGRLIDSQMLDYGLQNVDTSRFPDGSYIVDIVTNQNGGQISTQKRFFTRSGLIAPKGVPLISAEVGILRDQQKGTEILSDNAYQVTGAFRLIDNLQLELSSFGTTNTSGQSAGLRGIFESTTFGGGLSNVKGENPGLYGDLSGKIGNYEFFAVYEDSLQFNFENLTSKDRIANNNNTNPIPGVFEPPPRQDQAVRAKLADGAFVKRVGEGDIELRYEAFYISQEEQLAQYYYGPRFRWRLFEDSEQRVSFEVGRFQTERGSDVIGLFSYTYRFVPWTFDNAIQYRTGSPKQRTSLINNITYDTKDGRTGLGTRALLRNELSQDAVEGAGANDSIELTHGEEYGKGLVFLQNQNTKSTKQSTTGISADFTFTADAGGIGSAPGELAASLLKVKINSKTTKLPVDILVDKQKVCSIMPSSVCTIGVNPYRQYKISIAPSEKGDLIRYDAKEHTVVVFPGNVTREEWDVDKVFIGLGKILDSAGAPIINKRIAGIEGYAVTDDSGYFQADLKGGEKLQINFEDQSTCEIILPNVANKAQYYYDFGDVICKK